jgi:RNA polymerase sigma-70 factor, ECF subfamily
VHPRHNEANLARDGDLILRIRARDRSALEELYLCYHPRIARFLARFAPGREDAEEIINDTFMAVWMRAGVFRSESQVSTWIFGIAYRVAMRSLGWRRRHRRGQSILSRQERHQEPTPGADLRECLDAALARLPVEQRVTLTLAYQIGFSVEEISRIMQAPIGTVKSRMFHARQNLRECVRGKAAIKTAAVGDHSNRQLLVERRQVPRQ